MKMKEDMFDNVTKLAQSLSQEQRDRLFPAVLLLLCKGIARKPDEVWRCASLLALIRVCDPEALQDVFQGFDVEINQLMQSEAWGLLMRLCSELKGE